MWRIDFVDMGPGAVAVAAGTRPSNFPGRPRYTCGVVRVVVLTVLVLCVRDISAQNSAFDKRELDINLDV